ncbi:MAG TPA: hypothetical protein VHM26_07640 [Chitinophagaceae bacterium]|jgi:hypothetical protein|nr:hypothetical protein [Chitinophagaceae bacterium]
MITDFFIKIEMIFSDGRKNIDVFEVRDHDIWIRYHCHIEGEFSILIELDENADWISITGQKSYLISQIGTVIESYAA